MYVIYIVVSLKRLARESRPKRQPIHVSLLMTLGMGDMIEGPKGWMGWLLVLTSVALKVSATIDCSKHQIMQKAGAAANGSVLPQEREGGTDEYPKQPRAGSRSSPPSKS